ncbi:hypothetical protein [Sorangium sp. So ce321]|uniref:hypothetical protein n=1 Tax=Sorangium sp. So ce321 TaxID=3133300 RepID=UPI003F648B4C
MVVRLAVDGLWMAELLGLDAPPPERRTEVIRRLAAADRGAWPVTPSSRPQGLRAGRLLQRGEPRARRRGALSRACCGNPRAP